MTDWDHIVDHEFPKRFDKEEWKVVSQPGVSVEELDEFSHQLSIDLPDEFRALYLTVNGLGIESTGSDDRLWLVQPLDQLTEFMESNRSIFKESHPNLASRFFPFIDWANGDVAGYLATEDQSLHGGIFRFCHELYKYDEGQNPEEFLLFESETMEQQILGQE